jgi:hypothetical protein
MEYLVYVCAALLGLLFRYNMGLAEACKAVGKSISDSNTNTGLQDAITPPKSTNMTLLTWIAIVALLGYTVYQFGWISASVALAVLIVVSILAGVIFIPKPDSTHYLKRIYHSMVNRYADFHKSGDMIRAGAMKDLIKRV